ncbi:hypothetical protein C437_04910 [Haloarcula vallismortis ATCC 29715]|nr:hypothetical protein C437_04910 [Haloarcula vallismortis ATCC 29715]
METDTAQVFEQQTGPETTPTDINSRTPFLDADPSGSGGDTGDGFNRVRQQDTPVRSRSDSNRVRENDLPRDRDIGFNEETEDSLVDTEEESSSGGKPEEEEYLPSIGGIFSGRTISPEEAEELEQQGLSGLEIRPVVADTQEPEQASVDTDVGSVDPLAADARA